MSYLVPGTGNIVVNVDVDGGGGTGGASNLLALPFAFGDVSPATIGSIPANKHVLSVRLFIITVFNGSGAQLQVGISGAIADLMAASENTPSALGEYTVYPGMTYGSDTPAILTITPGSGASTGAGLVVIEYEP